MRNEEFTKNLQSYISPWKLSSLCKTHPRHVYGTQAGLATGATRLMNFTIANPINMSSFLESARHMCYAQLSIQCESVMPWRGEKLGHFISMCEFSDRRT